MERHKNGVLRISMEEREPKFRWRFLKRLPCAQTTAEARTFPHHQRKNNMRRVSSRQRLVSWDDNAFGAIIADDAGSEDAYSEPSSTPSSTTSKAAQLLAAITKKRKRRIVHVIPSDEDDNDTPEIPNDVWSHIHGFLDKKDLQSVLQTSLHQRHMILQDRLLWQAICAKQWPWAPALSLDFPRNLLRMKWSPVGPMQLSAAPVPDLKVEGCTAQFTGDHGDRCIRADAPFFTGRGPVLRPVGGKIQPTLCSYFEISITAGASDTPSSGNDCIAIGIANASFYLQGRQPGWDTSSYGWHGDDGGLFHGAGSMRQPLEEFGLGDTVGCGIILPSPASSKCRVCFTKNGRYLGAPFCLPYKQRNLDWFPVVGIDAPHAVQCNFGAKPFQWDMTSRKRWFVNNANCECWKSNINMSMATALWSATLDGAFCCGVVEQYRAVSTASPVAAIIVCFHK